MHRAFYKKAFTHTHTHTHMRTHARIRSKLLRILRHSRQSNRSFPRENGILGSKYNTMERC